VPEPEPVPADVVDDVLEVELVDDVVVVSDPPLLVLPPVAPLPPVPSSVSSSQATANADPSNNANMLTKIVRFIDPSPVTALFAALCDRRKPPTTHTSTPRPNG
jgi:hypothetical protein